MEQKYSVLMSVYINEKPDRFVQAVNSMLEQTVSPDQVVIVQDGPVSDVLKVVLEQYQNEYPDLITVLVNEQNLGLGPSLNRGLLECRNELIARMDSDDVSRKDRIEKQLKMFEENESLSICGGVARLDGPVIGCSVGWDWLSGVRDREAGIWRKVTLSATGDAKLLDPQVEGKLRRLS